MFQEAQIQTTVIMLPEAQKKKRKKKAHCFVHYEFMNIPKAQKVK